LLERRIATLEERLCNERVITKKVVAKDVVSIGSKVKLRGIAAKQIFEWCRIVASAEAKPRRAQEEGRDRRGRRPAQGDEVQDPRNQGCVKVGALRAP
jgi:transcription elongation GreA/GreB family factor